MQRLEVEDQIEFAHIFEEAVEGLHEDLYEVEQGERRFGGGADDDEVKSSVVAVGHERWRVVVRGGGSGGLGGAGEERWEATRVLGRHCSEKTRNTHGRKLHAEFGRFATRVKISDMRRCWTLVSWWM
jgi:hypothetical protein